MRDMAKIGQLMLNAGRWGDQQVVPADWVKACVSIQSSATTPPRLYGYQWWLGADPARPTEPAIWNADGWGGQRIHVIPAVDAVIVHTGSNYAGTPAELDKRLATHLLPLLA
jgi:CubicO group peptidase (beta-lactamase class C family)